MREHVQPYDFAQATFHAVARDAVVGILGHDDPDPGMTQKGSDVPDLEIRGPESLPLQTNGVELSRTRQARRAREPAVIRPRRTSTAA